MLLKLHPMERWSEWMIGTMVFVTYKIVTIWKTYGGYRRRYTYPIGPGSGWLRPNSRWCNTIPIWTPAIMVKFIIQHWRTSKDKVQNKTKKTAQETKRVGPGRLDRYHQNDFYQDGSILEPAEGSKFNVVERTGVRGSWSWNHVEDVLTGQPQVWDQSREA